MSVKVQLCQLYLELQGYSQICLEEADPCLSNPCENGGSCQRNISSFTCQCLEGYTGGRCETASLATESNAEDTISTDFKLTTESPSGVAVVGIIITVCAVSLVIGFITGCVYLYKVPYKKEIKKMDATVPGVDGNKDAHENFTFFTFLLDELQCGNKQHGSKIRSVSYQKNEEDGNIDVNDNEMQDKNNE
ncbi:Neurogenic locus notch-like protein 2 [Holothuria leucospilota]|uniref:Neurogenic locus notch-like protein 2 n=1 Tax=Holothuria leucospilota TaxID=206669 RepID=A0A9Q1BUV0_HOLLE|nr:Neurogenic locus notch-like protein 2 [Holothuria leucospilota]